MTRKNTSASAKPCTETKTTSTHLPAERITPAHYRGGQHANWAVRCN
ncbi:hypothetical protein [Caudoviricetes sp.]|nr:hypothetical protein [Caudoviricetes sp.]UOF81113.1 hypothetical protein [Caudoviricetes sp.]UOF82251.1 hypothetical protein [Caudoviricetes sp.]UOF82458.1 hypothetical protein [Caudoviricetes sp.]UOF82612.1 hypothetical protein [Caudoviricetes sp.]